MAPLIIVWIWIWIWEFSRLYKSRTKSFHLLISASCSLFGGGNTEQEQKEEENMENCGKINWSCWPDLLGVVGGLEASQ